MHRCLYVSEIVANITDNVLGNGDWASVAALARTCKSLHEPALDTLWRTQVGMVYLIKCMSEDAWEEHDLEFVSIDGWQRNLSFTRPLGRSDFQKIAHLTMRIKTLVFLPAVPNLSGSLSVTVQRFPRPSSVLSGEAFKELTRCRPTMFMPKLRTLWMLDPLREEVYRAPVLFPPTLNSVLMASEARLLQVGGAHYAQGVLCSALSQIQRVSRMIEKLYVIAFTDRTEQNLTVDVPILVDVLPNLKHLRLVHLMGVSVSLRAYSALRSLPHLNELIFEVPHDSELLTEAKRVPYTRATSGPSFPSLKTLHILANSVLSSATILSLYPLPVLESFSTVAYFDAPEALFRALHDRVDHATLNTIQLYHTGGQYWDGEDPIVPASVSGPSLAPLFAFRGLVELCIRGPLDLSDDDVLSLATAWPKLARLSVYSEDDEDPPRITLRGLRHLVERCHALHALGISFSMIGLPDAPPSGGCESEDKEVDTKNKVVQNFLVTHIHIGVFHIDGMTCVQAAEGLIALFPNLRPSEEDGEHNTDDAILWREVETHFCDMLQ